MEIKNKIINFLKEHMTGILFIVLLIVVPLGIVLIKYKIITEVTDIIAYYGFCFTVFSILYAAIQFRSNHDWNRRQLAITAARQVKKQMNSDILCLNKKFNYLQLKASDLLEVDDIHEKMCCVGENGKFQINDKGKYIIDYKGDGHKTQKSIYNLLNDYEYIAAGVHQGVFDKRIIKTLFQGPLIKAYSVFKNYIKHFNDDLNPERRGSVWVNMKNLAEEFIVEEEKEMVKADRRKKTG